MMQGNFMSWTGTCVKCGKMQRVGHSLFCSDFLLGRANFPLCRNYESGAWNLERREKSPNCREAENLTDRLERLVASGSLHDHKVFLITYNSSFEGAYYKGHSPSRQLSEIVFRVHKAERDGGFILHVIHISGKRMKASGVDGLSQGDLTEGMMGGKDPLSFIPFHLGADERANGLVGTWVQSWWRTKKGAEFGGLPLT